MATPYADQGERPPGAFGPIRNPGRGRDDVPAGGYHAASEQTPLGGLKWHWQPIGELP